MIIEGKSLCSLCKKVLEKGDKIQGFPAFLPYDHRFGKFSDAAMHEACYLANPDHDAVDDMLYVYEKLVESIPKGLKTVQDIEAAHKEVFQDWPPKNGVVVYRQCFPEEGQEEPEWFWSDKDMWEAFEKAEQEAQDEMKARREAARQHDREMLRYSRDDDY